MIVREYLGTSDYAGTVQFRLDENTAYSVEELLGKGLGACQAAGRRVHRTEDQGKKEGS